jgi:S-phase kinase-associated protein 1
LLSKEKSKDKKNRLTKKKTMSASELEIKSLDDHEDQPSDFTFISNDEKNVPIPRKAAMMSQLIKTMSENDPLETNFPLPNVNAGILKQVVDYMIHHCDNPGKEIAKPIKSTNMSDLVSQWDADYTNVDQQVLFDLIMAANYMDVKPLLDLLCAKVASMVKGRSIEEIRATFAIDVKKVKK